MENLTGLFKKQIYGCDRRTDPNCCYKEVFMMNGKKEGIEKKILNGELYQEIPYVNGIKHGIEKHYNKDKVFFYVYENGENINAYVEFITP